MSAVPQVDLASGLHLASPAACGAALSGGRWVRARHLNYISDAIVDHVFDRLNNVPGAPTGLLVFAPPRHGKTQETTLWTPTWFLGLFPEKNVGLGCYGDDFARSWGGKVRNNIRALYPDLQIAIATDSKAADEWRTAEGGGMVSSGIGGEFTGRGFHLLIVDDPVKNAEDAQSVAIQDRNWDWWLSTARTRLEPGGVWIMILTRWHERDLAGRIIAANEAGPDAEGYEAIRVISLPALAEDDDELGRARGEPLWPERYDETALRSLQRTMGPFWWAALFQQRPAPAEGGILRRASWRFWIPPEFAKAAPPVVDPDDSRVTYPVVVLDQGAVDEAIQSWDLAFKGMADAVRKGKEPDPVAGHVWARLGANLYMLDRVNARMAFSETCKAVLAMARKWNGVERPETKIKLVEDKANGPALRDFLGQWVAGLVAASPGRRSKVLRVTTAVASQGDKDARVMSVEALLAAGNMYLPHPVMAPWVWAFIRSCADFPNGANDDDIDAMSQAVAFLQPRANREMGNAAEAALEHGEPVRSTQEIVTGHVWAGVRAQQERLSRHGRRR
jgi:predicted phage terminase large subunit-like protein